MNPTPGKPWADLTSAERLDAVLLAVAAIENRDREDATGNTIAFEVNRTHRIEMPRHGNHGRGNVARRMSEATRVTPAITALRKRGLTRLVRRLDGRSGSSDILTPEGKARVRKLRGRSHERGQQ